MDLSGLDIETARLRLRAYRNEDADDIHAAVTPTLTRFMTFVPTKSADEMRAVGRKWLEEQKAGTSVSVVLRTRAEGLFVGMSGLHYRDDPEPEVGIWVREDRHRQGFGQEAVAALIRYAGEVMGHDSVIYPFFEPNGASRGLATSLGGVAFDIRVFEKKATGEVFRDIVYKIPTS
jgi:RimJ/RimL family protein N-acetyltransferase